MRRFAEAEDVLLDDGEVLEADFDGQVAAGDHDAERWQGQPCEEDRREIAGSLARLDLGDDAELRATLFEMSAWRKARTSSGPWTKESPTMSARGASW